MQNPFEDEEDTLVIPVETMAEMSAQPSRTSSHRLRPLTRPYPIATPSRVILRVA